MNSKLLRALPLLCLLILGSVRLSGAEVHEPKIGSPERVAIMEAMRGPVSKYVGKRVTFTGELKVSGVWAVFKGGAAPTDGVAPKGDKGFELTLDYFGLLRLEKGQWKLLVSGFSGGMDLFMEARQKYPQVPKELVPPVPQ
jgi:hypothetical protein